MITVTIQSQGTQAVLARAMKAARDMQPIMEAAGTTLLSITLGNFNQVGAAFRPIPWKAKLDGSPATLKKSGLLSSAFRLEVGPRTATLSNPAVYAAIHQFGGKTKAHRIVAKNKKALAFTSAKYGKVIVRAVNHPGSNVPARPFVPITEAGELTPAADRLTAAAADRELAKQIQA